MKRPFPISLGIFTLTSLLAVSVGNAASQTWTGGSTGNGSWGTAANWTGAAPGITGSSSNTDIATFNAAIANGWGTAGTPIVIDAGRKLGGLNFGANSGNYIIGATNGNALNLAGSGSIQLLSSLTTSANVAINAPLLLLGKNYSLVNNSASGSLTIGGAISSSSANTGNVLTLDGSNATNNTISGVISDGDSVLNAAGGMGITLTGAANWTLSSENTFTGITQINNTASGTLTIANALALQYSTINVNIPYSGAGGHFALADGITEVTFGGFAGNAGIFDSKITGFKNLTKLTLNTVAGKVVSLGGSSIGDNNKNMEVVKEGAGTQVFNGAGTYKGATTVNAGILRIGNANGLGTADTGTTVSGGALEIYNNIVVRGEALTLNGSGISGGGALRNISEDNEYSGAITLGSASRINSDAGTLTISGDVGGPGKALTVGGEGSVAISSAIATGSGTLTKDGSGTLSLSGTNTFTGQTTISAGTLLLSGSGSLASTVINNNATFNVSGVTGGFALVAGQSLKGSGRVIGAVSVGQGTLDIGNSPGTMTFDNDLTMTSDSTAHFEINGFGAGEFDLATGGTGSQKVTFGGTLNLTFQNGFNTLGSVTLFDFETYSGSFSAFNFSGLADGLTASFDQQTGKVFVTAAAVPEPTSAVLMLIGLGLGARFLSRRHNS